MKEKFLIARWYLQDFKEKDIFEYLKEVLGNGKLDLTPKEKKEIIMMLHEISLSINEKQLLLPFWVQK